LLVENYLAEDCKERHYDCGTPH